MVNRRLGQILVSSLLLAPTHAPAGGDRAVDGDPVDLATGLNIREHD